MYQKPPDPRELAAFGLRPEDVAGPPVEIWPENWEAFDLFRRMQTQWRVGVGGETGLDYNVLYHKMDRMNLTAERYEELEEDVQVMEFAALDVMRENRQQ